MRPFISASFLLIGLLAPPLQAQDYDVFILAGQSNMDGRGKTADLPDALKKPQTNVRFYFRNTTYSSNGWIDLAPGYSVPPGYKGDLPSATFGPEVNFGAQIAKAFPAKHIALIKVSKGGTSLSKDWNPGTKGAAASHGPLYKNFLESVPAALKALKDGGNTYTLRGLVWHQGESDAALSQESYEKLLTAFIGRVREDLEQPELPFVIGEVFDNGKRDAVRAAQLVVSKTVPHTAFASAANLKTWDNGTHFDAASQLILSERMAAEMAKLLGPISAPTAK